MTYGIGNNKKKTKKELMEGAQDLVKARIVAANTIEYIQSDGSKVIRLHNTDILKFRHDGTIEYNTGGWFTPTTKRRINEFQSRINVYQEKSVWYFNLNAEGGWRKRFDFFDGMIIDLDGKIVNAEKGKTEHDEKRRILKKIHAYIKGLRELESLPSPDESGGDCFYCQFTTDDQKSLGDATSNHSHLENHLDEGYYMYSLIMNALIDSGRTGHGAAIMYSMDIRDLICRAVSDYFKRRFAIAR